MRSGKGVASSPEPRSVLRPGIWLRIVLSFFFFLLPPIAPKLDWSRVWKEGGRGESLHRSWIYLHIRKKRSNGEGLV